MNTPTGAAIPIEQRSPDEVSNFGARPTAPRDVEIFNPAFDVTPADLISAIITEKGVAHPPLPAAILQLMKP
jgi:methylthioribose-1-phosphate isomerase